MNDERAAMLLKLAGAAYRLSAADARLRGRASRVPGALSIPHARALRVLAEQGPLRIGQLAQATETTGAATTQLVNGLVAAGYVSREQHGSDRRSVIVRITVQGRVRHEERSRLLGSLLEERLATYSPEELATVAAVLIELSSLYDQL